jgi:hypothetical protein
MALTIASLFQAPTNVLRTATKFFPLIWGNRPQYHRIDIQPHSSPHHKTAKPQQKCTNSITIRLLTLLGLGIMDVQQILDTYGGLPPSAFTVQAEASATLAAHDSIHGLYQQEQNNVHKITHTVRSCKI